MIVPDAPTFFNTLEFKLVPYEGCLAIIENAEQPAYVLPNQDCLYAVNMNKEYIKLLAKFAFLRKPQKTLDDFLRFSNKTLFSLKVEKKYMCPASYNTYRFLSQFLYCLGINNSDDIAYNFAHIIEFDDAYKYRLQDMATECNLINMYNNPRKEIKRLVGVFAERQGWENRGVTEKIMTLVSPLLLLLLIPKVKYSFINSIPYIEKMRYNKYDMYWLAFKGGYNFCGKTREERRKEIKKAPYMYQAV
jgi:hypothetical protein